MAKGGKVGAECYVYRNTGTYSSPTWTLVANVVNANLNFSKSKAQFKARSRNQVKNRGVMQEHPLTLDYEYQPGTDAAYDAFLDSYLNNTSLDLLVLDGPKDAGSGSKGFRGPYEVFSMPHNQQLEEGIVISMELDVAFVIESGTEVDVVEWDAPAS